MDKKLSQKTINTLRKKYETPIKERDYSARRRLKKDDYLEQTDRNYKDGDRN